jgi:hypothetical protein
MPISSELLPTGIRSGLVAFRSVPSSVHSVAEDDLLVAMEHLSALREAGVPFDNLPTKQIVDFTFVGRL